MADDPKDLMSAITAVREAQARARSEGVEIPAEVLESQVRSMTGGKHGYDEEFRRRVAHRPFGARDFGRGIVQGLAMEWGDEMGLVDKAKDQEQLEANPAASIGSRMVGGLLPALLTGGSSAAASASAPLAARMAATLATGTVAGGIAGAGAAEPGERMAGAGEGSTMGGLLSIPFAAGQGINAMRPSVRARARLESAASRSGPLMDKQTVPQGVEHLRDAATRMQAAGRPAMLADLSPAMMLEGEFAAQNAPEVFAPMESLLRRRQMDMSRRLLRDTDQALPNGNENTSRLMESMKAERQQWADSEMGYAGLRRRNPRLNSEEFVRSLQEPRIRDLWRQARLAGDIDEANLPPAIRRAFLAPRNPATGNISRPIGFRDLHSFRQLLNDKADQAFASGGRTSLGPVYKSLRNEVDAAIERQVPEYRAVNEHYRMLSGRERALDAGGKAWNTTADDLQTIYGALQTPAERDAFRRGMAGAIVSDLRNAQTNRRVATDLVNRSVSEDEKLQLVFGDQDTFRKFVQGMEDESQMARTYNTVVGNSRTALRQGMKEADIVEVGAMAGSVPSNAIPISLLARLGPQYLNRETARQMGRPLMARGPELTNELDEIVKRYTSPARRAAAVGAAATAPAAPNRRRRGGENEQ